MRSTSLAAAILSIMSTLALAPAGGAAASVSLR